jgi:hypothetical protein
MTAGSYNRNQNSPSTVQFKQWFPKLGIPEPSSWTSRTDETSIRESSRNWNGTDRPNASGENLGTKLRYYTVFEMLPGKDGRLVRTKVKKSFVVNRRLKRTKDNTPHPYVCDYRTLYDPCDAEVTEKVYQNSSDFANGIVHTQTMWRNKQFTALWMPTPTYPAFDANMQISLVNKLKGELRGSDFNMATFLGEGHQSLAMIAQAATRLARGYQAFRKGDLVDAASWLLSGGATRRGSRKIQSKKDFHRATTKSGANNWLELQYGWLPLLSDMKAGAEQLSHLLHVPFKKRYSVTKRWTKDCREPDPGPELRYWSDARQSVSRRIIATISEPESLPVVSGILDPELVAWELTPFSFVADWVVPIGDYLEARAFASRLSGLFVTSQLERCRYSGFQGGQFLDGNGARTVTSGSSGSFYFESARVSRSVSSVLEVPMPQVKPFSKVNTWKHCVNAIALLVQAVKH